MEERAATNPRGEECCRYQRREEDLLLVIDGVLEESIFGVPRVGGGMVIEVVGKSNMQEK